MSACVEETIMFRVSGFFGQPIAQRVNGEEGGGRGWLLCYFFDKINDALTE